MNGGRIGETLIAMIQKFARAFDPADASAADTLLAIVSARSDDHDIVARMTGGGKLLPEVGSYAAAVLAIEFRDVDDFHRAWPCATRREGRGIAAGAVTC